MEMEPTDREFVQSLARGLAVLQCFDGETPRLTLSEVAKRTGLTRASARRLLHTLVRLGHIATTGKLFWLRPQILSLSYPFLAALPWWRAAQPIIERASHEMREACYAVVLDGLDITYVACVAGTQSLSINLSIGSRLPAFTAASGRVLLASLPEADLRAFFATARLKKLTPKTVTSETALRKALDRVRRDGYCLVEEEYELGLRTLSVPLVDRSGRVLAAISMNRGDGAATGPEMIERYLPALKRAQHRIQAALET